MQRNRWYLALGLLIMATSTTKAEILKGTMAVTGGEMS
jgi:hypothetical protein